MAGHRQQPARAVLALALAGSPLPALHPRSQTEPAREAGLVAALGPQSGRADEQKQARPKTATANELKAAFTLQFARYVSWPAAADAGAEFTIAVVGDEELGATLATELAGKKIGDRPVIVRNLGAYAELADKKVLRQCQVLLVAGPAADWEAIRADLGGHAVLTVSAQPGFARRGGMIELYPDGRSFRFEVAPGALHEAGLSASSKMLKLSQPRPDAPKRNDE